MTANKKHRKRQVRRSDSLHLSIHAEPRDPPDIDKLARVLIDVAQSLAAKADPVEAKMNETSSAEETSRATNTISDEIQTP